MEVAWISDHNFRYNLSLECFEIFELVWLDPMQQSYLCTAFLLSSKTDEHFYDIRRVS